MAGVLLLHMSEEQAFDMLKYLMYDLGIRQQYRPDMVSLQVSQIRARFDYVMCICTNPLNIKTSTDLTQTTQTPHIEALK